MPCSFYLEEVVVGFHGLAAGLAHIHSNGVVDQDFHAGNVMISLDGKACVKADLGSAHFQEEDGFVTELTYCQ